MTDNMLHWNAMARPPKEALKKITGGRLSNMTNISPQWRYKIMTEMFGMVGFGWKYTVEKVWTSPAAKDEHFAFATVHLFVKINEAWSDAIPGEGGSMLISNESKGMHNNDEAFKMAVTDALGTAMAKLGVGADIYLGAFDGSKYTRPATETSTETQPEVTPNKASIPVDQAFPKEMVEEADELVKSYTAKEFRADGDLVKSVAEQAGVKPKDIVLAVNAMQGEFTVAQLINQFKKEE